ncbi:MAG: Na/Pi cotransporter family protein [Bacillota bacterium]
MLPAILKGFGGIGLFLLGMMQLKSSLAKLAGKSLHRWLTAATGSLPTAFLAGVILTGLVQSSSLVTVLTIGLVSARLMTFHQALGIVLGTNIGTTFTGHLLALDLDSWGLPLAAACGCLSLVWRGRFRHFMMAMAGLGVVFWAMGLMSTAADVLHTRAELAAYLASLDENHWHGVLAGIVITALLQSSSLVAGITMALADQSAVTLSTAIAIILGGNIGTCATAVLASVGSNTEARRVSAAHVVLNLFGVIIFFPFINLFAAIIQKSATDLSQQVANANTIFNLISSLAVLPWSRQFASLITWMVREPGQQKIWRA